MANVTVACLAGLYPAFNTTGDSTTACVPCPDGGFCDGVNAPVALPGFFETVHGFLQCVPPGACLGGPGSPCSSAYQDHLCLKCATNHYRLDESCKQCPDLAILFIIAFCVAGIVMMVLLDAASRRRINLSAVGIGVDFIQIMSVFTSFRFAWPPSLQALFDIISFVSINDQILAPECTFGSGSDAFERRWFAAQALPILIVCMAFTKLVIKFCWRKGPLATLTYWAHTARLCCRQCTSRLRCRRPETLPVAHVMSSLVPSRAHRLTSRSTATANQVLSAMSGSTRNLHYVRSRSTRYQDQVQSRGWRILIQRRGDFLAMAHRLRSEARQVVSSDQPSLVDSFVATCLTSMYYLYLLSVRTMLRVFDCSDSGDGTRFLDAEPSLACDRTGAHGVLYPFGIASIVLYAFGIPATFGTILFCKRNAMRADQQLLQYGRGFSARTNPNIGVRHRYARLYSHFKPRQFYWRVLLLLRKFMIATVAVMFDQSPMFQAALSIGTLFMFYVLHAQFRPFLRSPKLPASAKHDVRTALPSCVTCLLSSRVTTTLVKLLMRPFSFNLLETLYLGGALVVLLSGMVYESGQLDHTPALKDVMTVTVAMILILALLSFILVALLEVFRANIRNIMQPRLHRHRRPINRPSRRNLQLSLVPPAVTPPPSDGGSGVEEPVYPVGSPAPSSGSAPPASLTGKALVSRLGAQPSSDVARLVHNPMMRRRSFVPRPVDAASGQRPQDVAAGAVAGPKPQHAARDRVLESKWYAGGAAEP